jgi:predicted deacylase
MRLRHFDFCVLLLVAALSASAHAQTNAPQTVHRCVGAHGEVVFSGLPCGESNAAPIAATPAPAAGDGPASTACPATRIELRDRVAAAIARRDANAIAGLLRWRGVGAASTSGRLKELNQLAQRPLLAIDDDASADSGDALRVRTGSGDSGGVREHRFDVGNDGSCYWLTW